MRISCYMRGIASQLNFARIRAPKTRSPIASRLCSSIAGRRSSSQHSRIFSPTRSARSPARRKLRCSAPAIWFRSPSISSIKSPSIGTRERGSEAENCQRWHRLDFSAVMAIVGRWEMQQDALEARQSRYKLSIPIGDGSLKVPRLEAAQPPLPPPSTPCWRRAGRIQPSPRFHSAVKKRFERFVLHYVDLITSTPIATLVCIIWVAFIAHSVFVSLILKIDDDC